MGFYEKVDVIMTKLENKSAFAKIILLPFIGCIAAIALILFIPLFFAMLVMFVFEIFSEPPEFQ